MDQNGVRQDETRSMYPTYVISCSAFIAVFLIVYLIAFFITDDFVVRPHVEDSYYHITDEVSADAAVIYNITGDTVVAGKNITTPKSIASITKLTAALLAYPRLDETDITVLDSVDFEIEATTPLRLGDTWHTSDLLAYSLITSSNRGINAVGRTIEDKTGTSLVDLMNDFVRQHALVHTHFINPTGLDAHDTLAGSESSVFDMAKIAGIIVNDQPELAEQTVHEKGSFYSLDGIQYDAKNTNELIGSLSERILLSKTGYTDIAGGALIMVVERNDTLFALVVLDSTRTGRFEDMKKLLLLHKEIEQEKKVY